jgi:transcriptional regulator with PAS, ATPase and Fis domain
LDQITCKAIAEALQRNGNNREKAAAELGISARTIYRKIKEFNLE